LKRSAGRKVYLEDSDVPLDTNYLERALRLIPMCTANGYFAGLKSARDMFELFSA
jgi:hypothetical protein